jgi:hypothetical protein
VESKACVLVVFGEFVVVTVTSTSGGLGYMYGVYEVAPHGLVLRLLCMMIDALRCVGIAYLPGTIKFCASSKTLLGVLLSF